MFIHNLKYNFKFLFKSKSLIFWTFAFPIILGTFFNMAFKNIENSEKLDIIDIAIVDNDKFHNNIIMKEAFNILSDSNNKDQLFNIKYVNLNKAKKLLEDNKITGYLLLEQEPKVVVSTNGINETILKQVVEQIIEEEEILNNLIVSRMNNNQNLDGIYQEINDIISDDNINIKDISNNKLSYTMIEFYTLIAMTCLYGGILGMTVMNKNLANMSSNGKRIEVSPTPKLKLIISSLLASFITQLIGLFLLFIYTIFVLKVDYGNNVLLIILLSIIGSLAGLSLGIAVATLFKTNENTKNGIIISITMLGCFLSGMMGITMKYLIDKNIPIINKLNPVNMITDGFYSLYYYDTLDRYFFNIISLIIFTVLLILVSLSSLRRQKYDSI